MSRHASHLQSVTSSDVAIPPLGLTGILNVPKSALGLVVFAHGSGSSRLSPRNTLVAEALNSRGFATLLFDLLTPQEEADRTNVFDISLLAERLVDVVGWLDGQGGSIAELPTGLFGASTGAAAALWLPPGCQRGSERWFHALDDRTLPATRFRWSKHRPFSSSAAPTIE